MRGNEQPLFGGGVVLAPANPASAAAAPAGRRWAVEA